MVTFLINTASKRTGIALWDDGQWVADLSWDSAQDEAQKLLPEVTRLLAKRSLTLTDVRRLICVIGPGGFTSVRIGVSAVNAWAFASDLEVVELTLFALYPVDRWTIFSANRTEAWVREPGGDPEFVMVDLVPDGVTYCGEVSDEWENSLADKGCTYDPVAQALPDLSLLTFEKRIIKPWYYKDANITWSGKNDRCQTEHEKT